MSNLEDIPQVVALAANELWHELAACAPDRDAEEPAIARAIMAAKAEEREACAQMLEFGFSRDGVTHKTDECSHGRFGYEDCELCAAAAIRRRGDG